MFSQTGKLVGLCVAILLLVGCTATRPISTVQSVKVTDRTEDGVSLEVTVELFNPNRYSLPLPSAYYRIALENIGTFRFDELPDKTLPAGGTQTLVFPAAFAVSPDINLDGTQYNIAGEIYYHPPGEFRQLLDQYNLPLPAATFYERGQLQVNQ